MEQKEKINKILEKIENGECSTIQLRKEIEEVIDILKDLERSGFIERNNQSERITSCKWSLTPEGKSFLKLKRNYPNSKNYEIVMTLPPPLKKGLMEKHPYIKLTDESIKLMFKEAKEKIRILSPYVDASIIDFIRQIKDDVKCEFLTTITMYGKNAVLERIKQNRKNFEVRYLIEKQGNIQQFQTHAKLIIIDNLKLYIGSANFKDTSMLYNLEGGIILSETDIVKEYLSIFDDIYSSTKE